MGERYDVLVTLGDGVFPLVAAGRGQGRERLRPGAHRRRGAPRRPTVRPEELDGMIMTAAQLRAADDVRLDGRQDRSSRTRSS